ERAVWAELPDLSAVSGKQLTCTARIGHAIDGIQRYHPDLAAPSAPPSAPGQPAPTGPPSPADPGMSRPAGNGRPGHRDQARSSRFTKKSLVSVSGRPVKTPCGDCPKLAPRARMPPIRTVISGTVSVSR